MIRRLLAFLLLLSLSTACEKTVVVQPELTCSLSDVILPAGAGATAEFTVTASGKWKISASGTGYSVSPAQGKRGTTRVTLKADDANDAMRLRDLGDLTVCLLADRREESLRVFQQPERSQQTLLMYFPWSGNQNTLTRFFEMNIEDMESVVAQGVLENERVVVFFMPTETQAELFELHAVDGTCRRVLLKRYTDLPDFTTPDGLASILGDVRRAAPAQRYAMTVSCHGMAWLPASQARAGYRAGREKEHWEYENPHGPVTRWFGGSAYQTEIEDLAAGIAQADMKLGYILFDACYMATVEVAYALRHAAERLIVSPTEVMGPGFPYTSIGRYMVGRVDYAAVCREFYEFYMTYRYPYGTISVTECAEMEALADVMRRINERFTFDATSANLAALQRMDGYSPVRFFDLGDYVRQLCGDPALLSEFEAQLERTVPSACRYHTPSFYSSSHGGAYYPVRTYSGITISDPSVSPAVVDFKQATEWWRATH